MNGYASDRQRVEIILLAQMLWAVVEAGVADRTLPEFQECQHLLIDAMNEPVAGVAVKDRGKLIRRAGRAHLDVTEPYRREGSRCDKVALIVYFLVRSVTDCDYLIIGEGSNVARALDLFLPAIAHMVDESRLFESGRKHARKVLDHLQRLGYFGGVPFAP